MEDNIYEEEDDYPYADDEQIYMAERNVYERTGIGSLLTTYSLKHVKNPQEKFKILLSVIMERTRGELRLTSDDGEKIYEFASRDPYIIYRNVPCFILGYIGSNGGQVISEASLLKAFKALSIVKNIYPPFEGIAEADILRYSTFWLNNFSNK